MTASTQSSEAGLSTAFRRVRQNSMALSSHLSDEDATLQSMDDASPVKWHLAHTTWFWETFLLDPQATGYKPFNPAFRQLYNSYYNGISDQYPRGTRGLWSRPGLAEILAYRAYVDEAVLNLLPLIEQQGRSEIPGVFKVIELGLNHEQQHQELIVTDLQHLFYQNPLGPACYPAARGVLPSVAPGKPQSPTDWIDSDGQLTSTGYGGSAFCFDNELPVHKTYLNPFSIATSLVTNGEFAKFIDDGGYNDARWWLSEGFDWVGRNRLSMPLYWQRNGKQTRKQTGKQFENQWQIFTLDGFQPLLYDAPLSHISYFEADAYARYAGARLPTEFEWEWAAPYLNQAHGAVWQWTSSSYAPYPGFNASADAIGEYNGKFMVNQYVLRGSSFLTPAQHSRDSYRNFFPSGARWQASGIRLAKNR